MSTRSLYRSIRKPEYTGDNRCIPCTVVNVILAFVASAAIALVSAPIAAASLTLFLGAIYVRGYLVPGTPTLTRNYLPDRVLRWFDKDPTEFGVRVETESDLDAEAVLLNVGVLVNREPGVDLSLTEGFQDDWETELSHMNEDDARQTLGMMLGLDPDRISVLPRSRSFEVKVDGEIAGTWESCEAFVADMAAERLLDEHVENWADLPIDRRSGLLRGVRVWLERCPRCGGSVGLSEETVKSCCRSREVLASRCEDCGVRLFEINASEVESARH